MSDVVETLIGNHASTQAEATWWARSARQMVLRRLDRLEGGRLTVSDALGSHRFGAPAEDDLAATVHVADPSFYGRLLVGGSLGAAEAYMAGLWTCDDLVSLIRLLARNQRVLSQVNRGPARLANAMRSAYNVVRRNSRSGSRRNIAAHYDLSNDFFRLFLDETMTYSAGIFERDDSTMQQASIAKYDRICRKLQLSPSDHVVEIGTGWGGFALYAAQNYGCRVTTTTISKEQYRLAQRRVAQANLQGRIHLLLQDYRELRGQYDKLVSIEMVEAVGHEFLPTFMQQCANLLKRDGMALIQAITIPDERYDGYRRSIDFIQRYIFPGGCLPSMASIGQSLKSVDFRMFHWEDFGPHYATTLQRWREMFWENIQQIRQLGYSEEFIRMWHYYLCYCEGGFHERQIGLAQFILTKPMCRTAPLL